MQQIRFSITVRSAILFPRRPMPHGPPHAAEAPELAESCHIPRFCRGRSCSAASCEPNGRLTAALCLAAVYSIGTCSGARVTVVPRSRGRGDADAPQRYFAGCRGAGVRRVYPLTVLQRAPGASITGPRPGWQQSRFARSTGSDNEALSRFDGRALRRTQANFSTDPAIQGASCHTTPHWFPRLEAG